MGAGGGKGKRKVGSTTRWCTWASGRPAGVASGCSGASAACVSSCQGLPGMQQGRTSRVDRGAGEQPAVACEPGVVPVSQEAARVQLRLIRHHTPPVDVAERVQRGGVLEGGQHLRRQGSRPPLPASAQSQASRREVCSVLWAAPPTHNVVGSDLFAVLGAPVRPGALGPAAGRRRGENGRAAGPCVQGSAWHDA